MKIFPDLSRLKSYSYVSLNDSKAEIVKWKAVKGSVYFKNKEYEEKIEALKCKGAIEVTVQRKISQPDGSVLTVVDKKDSEKRTRDFSAANNASDCHGTTFADGEV